MGAHGSYKAAFLKEAALSKKTKRNIGNALITAGISVPLAFGLRGKFKASTMARLAQKGAVKDFGEMEKAIASHVTRTKANLPSYKLGDLSDVYSRGTRVVGSKDPVLVLRDGKSLLMGQGPAYYPARDVITLGHQNILNPKILLHELGHAADPELANYRPGLRFSELFKGLINPEKTRMMQAELRAWDNAKILKGDALREAALDTYRNSIRGGAATMAITPASIIGGIALKSHNKDDTMEKKAVKSLIGRGVGRYVELLLGGVGRRPALKEISKLNNKLDKTLVKLKKAKEAYRLAGDPRADMSHITDLRNQIVDLRRNIAQTYKPIAWENRKVKATRALTGIAGLTGLGMYMNRAPEIYDPKGYYKGDLY